MRFQSKNNIPPSESDEGAEGHGTVVFAVVTTVPCSGLVRKPSKSSELFEGSFWPERWNVVTTPIFETSSSINYQKTTPNEDHKWSVVSEIELTT